jgi:hypothetical protein
MEMPATLALILNVWYSSFTDLILIPKGTILWM